MPLDISQIQALCFDLDGTLRDTDDHFVIRLARWFRPFSFILPNRDPLSIARRIVMATEGPGNLLFGHIDRFGFDHFIASLGDFIYRLGLGKEPDPYSPIPGITQAIRILQKRYPLAIATNRKAKTAHIFLDEFRLTKYFNFIATAETCNHIKPNPCMVIRVAEHLGVSPEACLVIGDTTVDILAGKAAGSQTVGVLCGFGEENELRQAGADLILKTTSDITNVLFEK